MVDGWDGSGSISPSALMPVEPTIHGLPFCPRTVLGYLHMSLTRQQMLGPSSVLGVITVTDVGFEHHWVVHCKLFLASHIKTLLTIASDNNVMAGG